ncbi:MAG: ATP-binding protein [Bacteroidota bacterium]
MDFRRYNIILIALILLLVISAALFGWALSSSRMHLAILLGFASLFHVVLIFRRLTRTNREILFFFRALENEDTNLVYSSGHRNSLIDELHQHLDRVNGKFREMKIENEIREQYFSRILENLSSGIILIARTGHVNHINDEALSLLNLTQLTHIKSLSRVQPGLYERISGMKSLDRSELEIRETETGMKRVLGLQMVDINLRGEDVRIVTLHDLSAGMERKEIDDWIRLIRIMSHEIMNSLAPITSISTTLKEVWAEHESAGKEEKASGAAIGQTLKGLDAIAEQSEGLTTFFESYRVLSRIPDPVKKEFELCTMMEKLETLVSHKQGDEGIRFIFRCHDRGLKLTADEQMITQVMLNLVKNAVQAVERVRPAEITVSAEELDHRVVLSVNDNGHGIPGEIADEIFLPFFTTRAKGTGVGLSYSRQVMAMNGGRIEFESQPGSTRFRLLF